MPRKTEALACLPLAIFETRFALRFGFLAFFAFLAFLTFFFVVFLTDFFTAFLVAFLTAFFAAFGAIGAVGPRELGSMPPTASRPQIPPLRAALPRLN